MSGFFEGFASAAGDISSALSGSRSTGACVIRYGFILSANTLVGELTGRREEDIRGRPWADLVLPEDIPYLGSGRGSGAAHEGAPFHFRIKGPDGKPRWMVGTLTPLSGNSEPDQLLLMADVSEYGDLHEEARAREEEVLGMTEGTLRAIEKIVEMKDPFIAGHQRRVARLCYAIARQLGFSGSSAKILRMAALVHDVGKVSIPIQVLAKPMHLSDDEYSIVRMHPLVGYEILKDIEHLAFAAEIILQHHERTDGSGYPSGLTGENMLPEAKILSVADVIEAMISQRPHRPALGLEEALAEVKRGREKEYDSDVVDACLGLFSDPGFTLEMIPGGVF